MKPARVQGGNAVKSVGKLAATAVQTRYAILARAFVGLSVMEPVAMTGAVVFVRVKTV